MSDNELTAKVAVIVAVVIGIIAAGYVIVFAIAPIFVVASIIDFGFRSKYNAKLDVIRGSKELNDVPDIHDFKARYMDGRVGIGWMVDLPRDGQLDIYRLTGSGGGSVDDIEVRGDCVLSTARDFTSNSSEIFYDDGLPEGVYFYVPVVSGLGVTKEPLSYSFLSFWRELQFTTRRKRMRLRAEACRVEVVREPAPLIEDARDDATKMADEVLSHFKERKKIDADLDAAIARIQTSPDLSEAEKEEAIELMETRAASL